MGDDPKRDDAASAPATFGSPRFYALLSQLAERHGAWAISFGIRGADDNGFIDDPLASARYTAPDFAVDPWIYELMRVNENLRRMQAQIVSDTIELDDVRDCALDIASHALVALIFLEEQIEEEANFNDDDD